MAVSWGNLFKICSSNLVELKFVRRNKKNPIPTRRMLCTLDSRLLRSTFGKNILNFKVPKFKPPYNAKSKNLLTVWDILLQDWRNIPCDSIEVVSVVPTVPLKNFLVYFDKHIKPMTTAEKEQFLGK